ncbi:BOI-related E3 ubiquitin-protein ligase 1 isoform X1 [Capsicum annuum]|uniref:BOI-related E3 ubiquitin-protein ligase 1 isoform X1 n=1 Tax=Capsicum annuum TaxID=4072 RepID=UPI001FB17657|nr:BOI-related E3 ubiquitin-protein ligase 1 isoform X1 [Capsicum annuum]
MAVQAQYPSNVLFLNRNVQEGKGPLGNDYSLQPRPGGAGGGGGGSFLDQTQMLFNPGAGSNSRKRGRELTSTTAPMNPLMTMQSQPQPQLIDLTQLHTSAPLQQQPPNVVSTGLRLAFGDQQQQQQQHQLQQQQHHHHHNSLSPQSSQSSAFYSILTEDLATHIKQQRDEIDHLLLIQGEQLRRTLAEKRQRHYRALIGAAEESMARRLREKEAEIEKAARRNAELEARAAQLTAEAQAWQARARAQEVTAATLQAQLQHAMINNNNGRSNNEREEGKAGEPEDAESAYIDPDRVIESTGGGPSCKGCRKRVASVVILPCRHMCMCRECDAVAQACPLCFSIRSSSVEVFFT